MDESPRQQRLSPIVYAAAGGAFLLLLGIATRYGYHRDEVYFVAAARRLAWGYVDQPPFTVGVAWLSDALFGSSVLALRLLPALATATTALIAGLVAQRLGGGPVAQGTAAVGIAGGGFFLASGHLLSTATFDTLFWAVVLLLLVHLLDGGDERLWLVVGLVVGVGLLNKHTMLFLVFGLLVGLVVTRRLRLLASRWVWGGAIVAILIWMPNLAWQVANDWPTVEMIQSLQDEHSGLGSAIEFLGLQLVAVSFVFIVPATAGLLWLLRSPEGERWRPIAVAFLVLSALFLIVGGQFYYVAPFYVVLLAAGGLWVERRVESGRSLRLMAGIAAIFVAATLPFALPILPASDAGIPNALNQELWETVGWPELAQLVADVASGLSPEQFDEAVVFTGSYGEAGALELLGPEGKVPAVFSGHNGYWMWGPPAELGPVIGVGYVQRELQAVCREVRQVAIIDNGYDLDNEEQGLPVWLCTDRTQGWDAVWEDVRHYN